MDVWRSTTRRPNGAACRRAWTKELSIVGADCGGEEAAAIYSLIGPTKLSGLDSKLYLRAVLTEIADHPISRIEELLPWNVAHSPLDPLPWGSSTATAAAGLPICSSRTKTRGVQSPHFHIRGFAMPDIPLRIPAIPVKEQLQSVHSIAAAPTSVVLFVGRTPVVPPGAADPILVNNVSAFEQQFGSLDSAYPLTYALWLFFVNGGPQALVLSTGAGTTSPSPDPRITVLSAIETPFNILVVPPDQLNGDLTPDVMNAALAACVAHRAMLILDVPAAWSTRAARGDLAFTPAELVLTPASSLSNCALYFPRVELPDPLNEIATITFGAAALVAAAWTQTDASHGIWKPPASIALFGITALTANVTDVQQNILNPLGINVIRIFPGKGTLVWGARTLSADQQYQYISVRRLQLYLESSLQAGLQWTTFEPNSQPLWSAVTSEANAFLMGLFHQGAFVGSTPSEAFVIRCNSNTTTAQDIANGKLNVVVGFAPLKAAEFIVISLQFLAGPPEKRLPS
jgi:hypothetical protein